MVYIHLGTTCTAWSRARHGIVNHKRARQKERFAVGTALFTAKVIRKCIKHNVKFTLENPSSSRLSQFKPIEDLFQHKSICFFTFDHCRFGMPFRTNEKAFLSLAMSCEGGHAHQHLKSSDKVDIDGKLVYRNLTRLAGAYPSRLCRKWAQIVIGIGPSNNSKCKVMDVEIHEFDIFLKEARRTTDRETSQAADAPDHPNWEGEANCDPRVPQEARGT